MDPATNDPRFLATVADWFETRSERLVLFRFRSGAGSRSYELHSSFSSLSERIARSPAGTAVSVFKDPQLPIRGTIDDAFIKTCVDTIPDGAEYLMVETALRTAGGVSWFHHGSGESHVDLRDDLEWSRGKAVAVGLYPPWPGTPADSIHAYVPDADGVVRPGAY